MKGAQAAAVTALLAGGLLRGFVTLPTNGRVEFGGKTLSAERIIEHSTPGALARDVLWSEATAQPAPVRRIGVGPRIGVRRYSRNSGSGTHTHVTVPYCFTYDSFPSGLAYRESFEPLLYTDRATLKVGSTCSSLSSRSLIAPRILTVPRFTDPPKGG